MSVIKIQSFKYGFMLNLFNIEIKKGCEPKTMIEYLPI